MIRPIQLAGWRPAPRRVHLAQIQDTPRGTDLSYTYLIERGWLNYGVGLGAGAVLQGACQALGVKPDKTSALIVTALGLGVGIWSVYYRGSLHQAEIAQFVTGGVTGIGGMQTLHAFMK